MNNTYYWQYMSAIYALDALLKAHKERSDNVLYQSICDALDSLSEAARHLGGANNISNFKWERTA
ncbi:hypothetical protein HUU62_08820 [Rhodoferax sp. 4810]|uniref:Uncharacterized protein n=1 Tax=Thiospirillum jenense TaxID=1653858 RepID=A0A839H9C7_9GAMM|nr:hypothetical protein [Thiospirillum jenense]MBB1074512.1 hypothetical protein [Rhodoferax jenense]MBB1125504.1 hypothetical protein [Thiospirillum jenense]